MRVAVLGGTRFIGRALVDDLLGSGHEVLVVHRGEHEPDDLPDTPHLHVHRRRLPERRRELAAFRPDGMVDMSAMTATDTRAMLDAVDPALPLVVASSMDVYRAYTALGDGTTTEALPLTEQAPVRSAQPSLPPERAPEGWDLDMAEYEKLDVERLVLARGATVCRLPFVYGEHDPLRREEFVLGRIRAGAVRMPIGPGTFLGSRGYAPEIARGLRLALENAGDLPGEVVNLCESTCASMRLWAAQIVDAVGADLELVPVPSTALPPDLALTGDVSQHLLVDPAKAARVLGWVHEPPEPCVRRSVQWHLAHPPDARIGLDADRRALRAT